MKLKMSTSKKRKHHDKHNETAINKSSRVSISTSNGLKPTHSPTPQDSASSNGQRADQISRSDEKRNGKNSAGDTHLADNKAQKSFADLGIISELCDACTQLGFKAPTPIQAEAIPVALEGRDVIGIAETGSGKTAAFALPILQTLMDNPQPFFALILAPTRELAFQISQQVEALGALIAVRCAVLVGGMDMVPQAISLGRKPHIVVATPGRLLDHLENTKGFSLRALKYLVMDEADRLLDLDFGPILEKILRALPRGASKNSNNEGSAKAGNSTDITQGRRTMLFSATMSAKVEHLQRASLTSPVRVSVATSDHQTVATLRQSYLFIPHKHKDLYLVHLLAGDRRHLGGLGSTSTSDTSGGSGGIIVFTRTVSETQRLSLLLLALGLSAVPIHGQLSQSSRLSALNKFKAGRRSGLTFSTPATSTPSSSHPSSTTTHPADSTSSTTAPLAGGTDILVATDIAARGLDIPAVAAVVNYDLPPDSKTYVHRVGRTARAGRAGVAVSLVTQYDVELWLRIERALGRRVAQLNAVPGSGHSNQSDKATRKSKNEKKKSKSRGERRSAKNGSDGDGNGDGSSGPHDSSDDAPSSDQNDTPNDDTPAAPVTKTTTADPITKDQVLILLPRVSEAQRLAARELRDMQENRGKRGAVLIGKRRMGRRGRGGGGGGGDEMDRDEG